MLKKIFLITLLATNVFNIQSMEPINGNAQADAIVQSILSEINNLSNQVLQQMKGLGTLFTPGFPYEKFSDLQHIYSSIETNANSFRQRIEKVRLSARFPLLVKVIKTVQDYNQQPLGQFFDKKDLNEEEFKYAKALRRIFDIEIYLPNYKKYIQQFEYKFIPKGG